MDILIRYGFSIEEINNIMNSNEEINDISDEHINEILSILEGLGCNIHHIKNILITNPFVLTREINEIKKIIVKLLDIGINDLNILFDSNPFLLNVEYKELDSFYRRMIKGDLKQEEILDGFYYNSYSII